MNITLVKLNIPTGSQNITQVSPDNSNSNSNNLFNVKNMGSVGTIIQARARVKNT